MRNPERTLPRHLVIIPDGNGRWAQKHSLPIPEGHIRGADTLINLANRLKSLDIEVVTFWGFSTENWLRGTLEVQGIMGLTEQMIQSEGDRLKEWGVRFRHIGRKDKFPPSLLSQITQLEEETAINSGKTFVLALDYGGRDEILRAVEQARASNLKSLDEETFKGFLDTAGLPDPDLIIRTAGEMRTSGMMPFQGVYAEFISSPVLFPDFDVSELESCLEEFTRRKRHFGARADYEIPQTFKWLSLPSLTFEDYVAALRPYLDRASESFIANWRNTKFYNSDALQEDITIYQRLLEGGKKLRAALLVLGFETFRGEPEFLDEVFKAAVGYEVIHNSFLIHDDIEDNSSTRRGKPSIHEQYRVKYQEQKGLLDPRQYGISIAINTGSLGAFRVLDVIWTAVPIQDRVVRAQKWVRQVIETTLQGQRRDLTDIPLRLLSEKDVYQIYHQKTAIYSIIGPLVLGAILAGAPRRELGILNTFGVNLGIAFQLIDDHLGLFGSEEVLGKPVGSDLHEAKKTLHFVRAYQLANPSQRGLLEQSWGKKVDESQLEEVRRLIVGFGIRDEVLERAEILSKKSKLFISRITSDLKSASLLESAAEFVVKREF